MISHAEPAPREIPLAHLPATARLSRDFDAAALRAALRRLDAGSWHLQRSYGEEGPSSSAPTDWRCLPLRSIGGDPQRTDPGGAGLTGFLDTRWLDHAPYLREVLDALPAQLRGVRLMRLGAGAAVDEHCDGKYGLAYGAIRLHVPITSNPGATLTIDGQTHCWEPGTLWYADFRRPHSVANTGERARVHMVIDTLVSPALLALFPDDFAGGLDLSQVILAAEPVPLAAAECSRLRCRFSLPASFLCWSEEEAPSGAEDEVLSAIDVDGDRLVLHAAGRPAFALVYLGGGQFRLEGWSDERRLQVDLARRGPRVRLLVRHGSRLTEDERQAESCSA